MEICKKCGYGGETTLVAGLKSCGKCGAIFARVDAAMKLKEEKKQADAKKQADLEAAAAAREAAAAAAALKAEQTKALKIANEDKRLRSRRASLPDTVVKSYAGDQAQAVRAFSADAKKMAEDGYAPTLQEFIPGTWGTGAFLLALVLCFVLIGFLIFIYMLIVKPAGRLTVTYKKGSLTGLGGDLKTCPNCAETVKAAAKSCRFCAHAFE